MYLAKYFLFTFLLISISLGYYLFLNQQINHRGFFEYVGVDFRVLYASGQIIRDKGMDAVYDIGLQEIYQDKLYKQFARYSSNLSIPFFPLRMPYLPVFVLPAILLTYLPPFISYLLYMFFNFFITTIYLLLWLRRLNHFKYNYVIIFVYLLSIYNFLNILFCQVNLILLISIGETLYLLRNQRAIFAGLVLALCWIKPQSILPLLPLSALILGHYRFITGFIIGSMIIWIGNFYLGGSYFLEKLINVLITWPQDLGTSGMTWRALTMHLEILGLPTPVAWIIGLSLVVIVIYTWFTGILKLKNQTYRQNSEEIEFGSTLVAQDIISIYGNVYMTIPIIIPLYILAAKPKFRLISIHKLVIWSLFPTIIFLLLTILSVGIAHDILGRVTLAINLYLLSFFNNIMDEAN
jgi:hypothetical protein